MTRKILAGTALSAALLMGTGAAAQAATGAYPPAQPPTKPTTVKPQVAPATNPKNTTTVLSQTDTTDKSTLPRTGAEWMGTAAVGGGLLIGGAGLVAASRRRQTV